MRVPDRDKMMAELEERGLSTRVYYSLGKMLLFVRKAEYKLEQEGEDDYL